MKMLQRNAIEGKFGEGKRKWELGRVRARGTETSLTVIALHFIFRIKKVFLCYWSAIQTQILLFELFLHIMHDFLYISHLFNKPYLILIY